jgi:hypothetical protein
MPIDAQTPDFVRKVTIAAAAVPSALETLRIGGIDRYGIYADLDGLAASLVAKNAGRGKPTQLDDD